MLLGRQRYGRATVLVRRKPAAGESENRSFKMLQSADFFMDAIRVLTSRRRHCEDRSSKNTKIRDVIFF